MRPEDVKSEWIDAFMHAFYRSNGGMIDTVTQSLAAVIPAIRAEALERAAAWHDGQAAAASDPNTRIAHRASAAAIRALGDK